MNKTTFGNSCLSLRSGIHYPQLASNYAGRIADSGVAGTVTNLYLTQITQDYYGNISGHLDGLYLPGPFTGTISKKGDLNFTMKITVGLLVVQGSIKVGGELQGTFKVVDPQGNSLGEYGVWSADPPKLS